MCSVWLTIICTHCTHWGNKKTSKYWVSNYILFFPLHFTYLFSGGALTLYYDIKFIILLLQLLYTGLHFAIIIVFARVLEHWLRLISAFAEKQRRVAERSTEKT